MNQNLFQVGDLFCFERTWGMEIGLIIEILDQNKFNFNVIIDWLVRYIDGSIGHIKTCYSMREIYDMPNRDGYTYYPVK